jgi:hypothetical protein
MSVTHQKLDFFCVQVSARPKPAPKANEAAAAALPKAPKKLPQKPALNNRPLRYASADLQPPQ